METANRVLKFVDDSKKGFPAGIDYKVGYDATKFVRAASDNPLIRVAFTGNPFTRQSDGPYGPELCRNLEVFVGDESKHSAGKTRTAGEVLASKPLRIARCTVVPLFGMSWIGYRLVTSP